MKKDKPMIWIWVVIAIVVGFFAYTKLSERNSYNDILDFCMSNAETPAQSSQCETDYKRNIGQ